MGEIKEVNRSFLSRFKKNIPVPRGNDVDALAAQDDVIKNDGKMNNSKCEEEQSTEIEDCEQMNSVAPKVKLTSLFSTVRNKIRDRKSLKKAKKARSRKDSTNEISWIGGQDLQDEFSYDSADEEILFSLSSRILSPRARERAGGGRSAEGNGSNMSKIDEEDDDVTSDISTARLTKSPLNKLSPSLNHLEQKKMAAHGDTKYDLNNTHTSVAAGYPSMSGVYAQQRYQGSSSCQVQSSLAERVAELELQLAQILKVVDNHLCLACGTELEQKKDHSKFTPNEQNRDDLLNHRETLPNAVNSIDAGGDCSFASRNHGQVTRLTRNPSPGPPLKQNDNSKQTGHSVSGGGGYVSSHPGYPTGLAAYKQLFDCIDYRYLAANESASLSCELLHHMLCNNSAAKLRLERAFESVRQLEMSGSCGLSVSKLDQILYYMGLVETRIHKEVVWEMAKELGFGGEKSRIQLNELIRSLEEYQPKDHLI